MEIHHNPDIQYLRELRTHPSFLGQYAAGPKVAGRPTIIRGPAWHARRAVVSRDGTAYLVAADGSLRRTDKVRAKNGKRARRERILSDRIDRELNALS